MLTLFLRQNQWDTYRSTGLLPHTDVYVEELQENTSKKTLLEKINKNEWYAAFIGKRSPRMYCIDDIFTIDGKTVVIVNSI